MYYIKGSVLVARCVCFGKKFSELKKIALKHNATTIEELQKHVRFGDNCKRCHPYVQLMLETGQTEFELIPHTDEPGATD